MSDEDLKALGRLLLKFLEDEEVFVWLDRFSPMRNRLVIDGNVWDLSEEECALVKKATGDK